MNNSPTLNKRSIQSKLQLQPGEVVIFGGLNSDDNSEDNTRLPFLKWWMGDSKRKSSSEILLFIEAQRI